MAGTIGILDELEARHGGVRRYVATLLVVGNASRRQVADAMAKKYNIKAPTTRVISKWKKDDPVLRDLIAEMQRAKADVAPGEDISHLIRRQPNPARVVAGLFTLAINCRPFAELLKREPRASGEGEADAGDWFEGFDGEDAPPVPLDPDTAASDDVLAVLAAEHETDAEFEADCRARLAAS